jgi:hypothetical protein
VLALGLAEAVYTGFYMEIYRFSLPFSYAMVICADIFLFLFTIEITDKHKKLLYPILLLGMVIIVLLFLPWNWWGIPPEDYAGQLNIRLYSTLSLVIYSYAIYGLICSISYKASKAATNKVTSFGLRLLLYSMVSMMLFFLMFVLDTLMIVLFNNPGYSIFVYIAWIFAIIFYILLYLSLVMPEWLTKRIS